MYAKFRDEKVRLDPDRLGTLYFNLGEAAAENAVYLAMEALSQRLADLPDLEISGDLHALGHAARKMVGIADEIGMASLAKVARDVAYTCAREDRNAAAATSARLRRIGDRSLTALCQLHMVP